MAALTWLAAQNVLRAVLDCVPAHLLVHPDEQPRDHDATVALLVALGVTVSRINKRERLEKEMSTLRSDSATRFVTILEGLPFSGRVENLYR